MLFSAAGKTQYDLNSSGAVTGADRFWDLGRFGVFEANVIITLNNVHE